jgi:dihydroorotate dehydrogenase
MYKFFIKPLLFRLDAERAHYLVFYILKLVFKLPGVRFLVKKFYNVNRPELVKEVFGIKFPNPVGLAAGFDKDACLFNELAAFGFGFIEIGTVTPEAQPGNPKPRLFRLPEDEALINRMGFNNGGVKEAAKRLKKKHPDIIVGGNIGKNKLTPNEEAVNDYLICFESLFDVVDYFVVNVSSPNTPGLRALQEKEPLTKLLKTLMAQNHKKQKPKPILLKIAPDLTNEQLVDIVDIVIDTKIAGIIATNTSISREGLKTPSDKLKKIGDGGLSGKPLNNRSVQVVKFLNERLQGKIPIIGVGGIHSANDAKAMLNAGASLVQVYTGFIYEGPGLIKKILNHI